jgi:hypothetical protein
MFVAFKGIKTQRRLFTNNNNNIMSPCLAMIFISDLSYKDLVKFLLAAIPYSLATINIADQHFRFLKIPSQPPF